MKGEINPSLQRYVVEEILPQYATFDKAHREDHARTVIQQSLNLAQFYDVNVQMVYAVAAFHDTGLVKDRKTHHLVSGEIIRKDTQLKNWFTPEEIETIAQAAEDHRASSDHEPRSIYGKIVAEADRLIDADTILRRTVQYGLQHYPEMDETQQIERALSHLQEKYAEGGYLKLWIPESPNAERLHHFQQLLKKPEQLLPHLHRIYKEENS